MKHPPAADPRLAAVIGQDGATNRHAVEALLSQDPSTLTLPEIEAMHVIFFETEILEGHPLWGVVYERPWLDAFVEIIGGTITREKIRHGKVVQHTVRRHRGRADVRRHRAEMRTTTGRSTPRRASRSREHRPAATRRASSSSSTSSTDPGDPEPEPFRLAPPPRAIFRYGCLTAAERGGVVA